MGTTNARSTKSYRIRKNTIKTQVHPNESISSWFIRAALDCGTKPLTFTGFYWDKYRLWTYDLDRGLERIDPNIYIDITILSLNSSVKLQKQCLLSILDKVNDKSSSFQSNTKWIIPRGSRNRTHNIGQYYCPYCLAEAPYLHNEWRLAWNFGCLKHGVLLNNKCMTCGSLYQPHHLSPPHTSIDYCHNCNTSLTSLYSKELNQPQVIALKTIDTVFKTNTGYGLGQHINSDTYFSILRYFINLLRRAAQVNSTHAIAKFVTQLGINSTEVCIPKTGLSFELLPLKERENLIINAVSIMNLRQATLINAIRKSQITKKAFAFEHYPEELITIIKYALVGKSVPNKRPVIKKNTQSIRMLSRKWECLKRQLKIENDEKNYRT
ncbi:TniQ family protein [Vibrio sp. S11_S32]|uniref:TniQ family protein n=1 Tax=Vibrio sp. S11_S32 TaxID=2720225 RepID=UPI0016806693|nr:TniQ family protein [Vibrio sp. S11_S32]